MSVNYELLGKKILGGAVEKDGAKICRFEETYRLQNTDDMFTFIRYLPLPGSIVNYNPIWRLQSCDVKRLSKPRGDGKTDLTVEYRCTSMLDFDTDLDGQPLTEDTPPWKYRVSNFQISSATQKEDAKYFWPDGIDAARDFTNTAGVPFEGTITRGLSKIAFTYNLQSIDVNASWMYVYKTNISEVSITGMIFPPRTVLLHNIEMKRKKDYTKNGTLRWQYFQVNIQLLADPESFNRDIPNLGTHILTAGGLRRLWSWDDGNSFGTYSQYLTSGAKDGEEVSEVLYLNSSGTGISPFNSGGIQSPVNLRGCMYEPVDFQILGLPQVY
ncbi:MAG: hypothetical protein Q4G69_00810 [Planctomycetia bacterium]|nr:hypothetical protein [Planctomycetia bacterium]